MVVIQIQHQVWLYRKGTGQVFGTEVCVSEIACHQGEGVKPVRERRRVYV